MEEMFNPTDWVEQLVGFPASFVSENYTQFVLGTGNLGIHARGAKSDGVTGRQVLYWRLKHLADVIAHFISLGGTIYKGTDFRNRLTQSVPTTGSLREYLGILLR